MSVAQGSLDPLPLNMLRLTSMPQDRFALSQPAMSVHLNHLTRPTHDQPQVLVESIPKNDVASQASKILF